MKWYIWRDINKVVYRTKADCFDAAIKTGRVHDPCVDTGTPCGNSIIDLYIQRGKIKRVIDI